MAKARTKIYLVPGFFGFRTLGALSYFDRVQEQLAAALADRGVRGEVVECPTQPTGSIRRRAERLLDRVVETGGLEADHLHFVGHSTGGLDVRLLLTPGVRLRPGAEERRLGACTRSVVTISTPHYGTPLASFFTTLPGRHLLEALTLLATTTGGRYAIFGAASVLRAVARVDDLFGRRETFLDYWTRSVLDRLSPGGGGEMWSFLSDVSDDQGAVVQLTPESIDLFNAAVIDHPDIRYASLVTAAPAFRFAPRSRWAVPHLAMRAAYAALHAMAAREHRHYPYPHPGHAAVDALTEALALPVTAATNDGIVPALSQVYGQLLGAVVADHLDVVGQYATDNPYSDWLPSGAGFDDDDFAAVWGRVADFVQSAEEGTRLPAPLACPRPREPRGRFRQVA